MQTDGGPLCHNYILEVWTYTTHSQKSFDLQLFVFFWTTGSFMDTLEINMFSRYTVILFYFHVFGLCFEDFSTIIKIKAIFSIWRFVCYILAACFWCSDCTMLCYAQHVDASVHIPTSPQKRWKRGHLSACVIQFLLNGLRSLLIFDYMWLTVATTCNICWHLNMQSLALTVWINLTSHVTHLKINFNLCPLWLNL